MTEMIADVGNAALRNFGMAFLPCFRDVTGSFAENFQKPLICGARKNFCFKSDGTFVRQERPDIRDRILHMLQTLAWGRSHQKTRVTSSAIDFANSPRT
jgi:hypothetical protein